MIDAPAEVVFEIFVEPAAQQELYGNDDDPRGTVASELDLRVGGIWTIVFGPAAKTHIGRRMCSPRSTVLVGWPSIPRCS